MSEITETEKVNKKEYVALQIVIYTFITRARAIKNADYAILFL